MRSTKKRLPSRRWLKNHALAVHVAIVLGVLVAWYVTFAFIEIAFAADKQSSFKNITSGVATGALLYYIKEYFGLKARVDLYARMMVEAVLLDRRVLRAMSRKKALNTVRIIMSRLVGDQTAGIACDQLLAPQMKSRSRYRSIENLDVVVSQWPAMAEYSIGNASIMISPERYVMLNVYQKVTVPIDHNWDGEEAHIIVCFSENERASAFKDAKCVYREAPSLEQSELDQLLPSLVGSQRSPSGWKHLFYDPSDAQFDEGNSLFVVNCRSNETRLKRKDIQYIPGVGVVSTFAVPPAVRTESAVTLEVELVMPHSRADRKHVVMGIEPTRLDKMVFAVDGLEATIQWNNFLGFGNPHVKMRGQRVELDLEGRYVLPNWGAMFSWSEKSASPRDAIVKKRL